MRSDITAGLLGPLKFETCNGDSTPTAQKQRKILALLLANDSSVVTMPTLMEELWETPPRSATTVIQTYVLYIRRKMAAMLDVDQASVASQLLQTRSRGYAFDTKGCTFDLHRYMKLSKEARGALAVGNDESAIKLFNRAEQWWRGDALVDIECGLPLSAEAARLDQTRLANTELKLEAQLRQRRYREAIIDLTGLVLQHPLNERINAYLMYALCLSGSRDRAQQVFIDLRRTMIEELGLEPCTTVQRLHRDILHSSDSDAYNLIEYNHDYIFWHTPSENARLPSISLRR